MSFDLDKLEVEIIVKYNGKVIDVDISDEALESINEDVEEYMEENNE
tara:strand:+ start:1830 stop:1970 length:141 start_codon:yes stop_codon:yes gene_type:complete